jgi:hypothetical protein
VRWLGVRLFYSEDLGIELTTTRFNNLISRLPALLLSYVKGESFNLLLFVSEFCLLISYEFTFYFTPVSLPTKLGAADSDLCCGSPELAWF